MEDATAAYNSIIHRSHYAKLGAAILSNNMKKCLDECAENRETALKDFQTVFFRYIDLS